MFKLLKPDNQNKVFCLSVDIEKDYGRLDTFNAIQNVDRLIDLCKKNDVKLTVFVVTSLLKEHPQMVEKFESIGCQIEPHSYYHISHDNKKEIIFEEQEKDVTKSIEAYRDFFKKDPQTYRFPQGVSTPQEIDLLKRLGLKYDCSIFPSWRPGLFNNFNYPVEPFLHANGLLEIPFSAVPKIRLPLALSYVQFLGWNFYKIGFNLFGWPKTLVLGFHLHNLSDLPGKEKLPLLFRLLYSRNHDKGFEILESFIKYVSKKGYKSVLARDIANNFLD